MSAPATGEVLGWRGEKVLGAYTPGGVLLLANYEDALLTWDSKPWPPPALVTRLVADNRASKKWSRDVQAMVSRRLGFYCPLQSINSEDAMTWSVFGPLADAEPSLRASFLNWICGLVGLPGEDRDCTVDLWRRVAHPQKPAASNGPELDAVLEGDRTVVFVECKWGSPEGKGQGPSGTATQMGLRREYLERFGPAVYGDRRFVVLGVVLGGNLEVATPPDSEHVATRTITWSDLCRWPEHPAHDRLATYFRWKLAHSTTRGARRLASELGISA